MVPSVRGADGLMRSKSEEASTLPEYPQKGCVEAVTPVTKTSVVKRIHDVATSVYQKTIVKKILQRGQLAASKDGRKIPLRLENDEPLIDVRRGHAYISNSIRTSRYTLWDFLPKQLFFQFSRVGNFYFLCVGIPQMVCAAYDDALFFAHSATKLLSADSWSFDHRLLHDASAPAFFRLHNNVQRRLRRLSTTPT